MGGVPCFCSWAVCRKGFGLSRLSVPGFKPGASAEVLPASAVCVLRAGFQALVEAGVGVARSDELPAQVEKNTVR